MKIGDTFTVKKVVTEDMAAAALGRLRAMGASAAGTHRGAPVHVLVSASPGGPAPAPGMDDARKIPYEILLVGKDGRAATYARH